MKGVVLNDRYEIKELIAEGGMSLVYQAYCRKTRRQVAVKILKPELATKTEYLQAFRQEAYATLKLRHRNIIHTLGMGTSGPYKYIAMELIEGDTLRQELKREGRLSVERCVYLARRLLHALHYAHHRGIVHKDLKPSNILIKEDGEPVITDFGIAEEADAARRQENGQVFGSVLYFSPEQAKGETVDARTDIYSLGIVLYEMLTGEPPYKAEDSLSVALKHLHELPPPPSELNPEVPESLNRIILKAIAKDKDQRYESAGAMYRDLIRCLDEPGGEYIKMPGEWQEIGQKKEQARAKDRAKIVAISLGALAVVLMTVAIWLLISLGTGTNPDVVYMPSLTDRTEEEAIEMLADLNIQVEVTREPSAQIEEGRIISQNPEMGAALHPGDMVHIVVSSANSKAMPNLVGETVEDALAALEEMGIMEPQMIRQDTPGSEGRVIEQRPQEGVLVNANSEITLTVGGPVVDDVLPSVVGLDIEDGVERLSQAGVEKFFVYQTGVGENPGRILYQSASYEMPESGENTVQINIQPAAQSNYLGVYQLDENLLADSGTFRMTVEQEVAGVDCEYVVFEEAYESALDFYLKFGGQIECRLYLPDQRESVSARFRIYIDDKLIDRGSCRLTALVA